MARIRSVKPEFWTDEKVVELSFPARLLFIGLWNFADDDGRMVYSPKRIKMQVFPADSIDVSELVGEIQRNGMVQVYVVEGVEYLQINNFAKHQKIDKRSASKLPIPPNSPESPRIPPNPADSSTNPAESHRIPPTEGNGRDQGREGIKEGKKQTPVAPLALPEWLPVESWEAWLEVRTKKKVPNTQRALAIAIGELDKLRQQGQDPAAILEQATLKGWRGIFPLPQAVATQPQPVGSRPSIVCVTCNQRAFTWTGDRCDPCWRKSQGMAA